MFTGRVVGPGEPMWTPEDTALALEWQDEKRLQCGSCGHHLDETTDDAHARDWVADELMCHACAVTEWRRKALSEQERDMAGLHVYARRRTHDGR